MAEMLKTKKLADEESAKIAAGIPTSLPMAPMPKRLPDVINIKAVPCCNDFVAVLQLPDQAALDSNILQPSQTLMRPEGVVIGFGPGLPDGAGGRTASQLELGDTVVFNIKSVVNSIQPKDGPYAGYQVLFLSERNLICKIVPNPAKFKLVTAV